MKITKYLHSCLLIEEENMTLLTDPGQFTYESKVLDLKKLDKLDYILITHEHSDHMHIPFIKDLINYFPNVNIISNDSVVSILKENGINAKTDAPEFIQTDSVPHEDVVVSVPPENTQFTIFNKLTHPGDSHHVRKTAVILCLPIQAPWGSFANALKLAEELNPKFIIPIHDWHWKDEIRKGMYLRANEYLKLSDIDFRIIETGECIEINA